MMLGFARCIIFSLGKSRSFKCSQLLSQRCPINTTCIRNVKPNDVVPSYKSHLRRNKVTKQNSNIARYWQKSWEHSAAWNWKVSMTHFYQLRQNLTEYHGYCLFKFTEPTDTKSMSNCELSNMSFDDLKDLLNSAAGPSIHRHGTPESRKVLKNIEHELVRRIPDMDLFTMIYFADALLQVGFSSTRITGHSREVMNHCENYCQTMLKTIAVYWNFFHDDQLSVPNVVLLLFCMSIFRINYIPLVQKSELYLADNLKNATILEISILCYSIFLIDHTIQSYKLLQQIAQLTLSNFSKANIKQVAAVIKALRKGNYSDPGFLEELGNKVVSQFLPVRGYNDMLHLSTIVYIYSRARYCHENLIKNTLKQLDIITPEKKHNRILHTAAMFDFPVSAELKRKTTQNLLASQDDVKFPDYFVEFVTTLAYCGVFNQRLIQRALSEHIKADDAASEQNSQLLMLKNIAELYFPGELSYPSWLKNLEVPIRPKEFGLYHRWGLIHAIKAFQELLGGKWFLRPSFILDFATILDLEFHLDDTGAPIKLLNRSEKIDDMIAKTGATIEASHFDGVIHELSKENNIDRIHGSNTIENSFYLPEQIQNEDGNIAKVVVKIFAWSQYLKNKPVLLPIHRIEQQLLSKKGYYVFGINPADALRFKSWERQETCMYLKANVIDVVMMHKKECKEIPKMQGTLNNTDTQRTNTNDNKKMKVNVNFGTDFKIH